MIVVSEEHKQYISKLKCTLWEYDSIEYIKNYKKTKHINRLMGHLGKHVANVIAHIMINGRN